MLTLAAIARDENEYIPEWIDFHRRIGFNRIIIYDNESAVPVSSLVGRDENAVIVRDWPNVQGQAPQISAYTDCLQNDQGASEWLMFLDLDEFLNLKFSPDVRDFTHRHSQSHAIAVNWRLFGSSGEVVKRPGRVTERFVWAAHEGFSTNAHVKTIFRPEMVVEARVHCPVLAEGAHLVDASGRSIIGSGDVLLHQIDLSKAQVNHYFTKSRQEFEAKRARGRGDVADGMPYKHRDEADFSAHDTNHQLDTSIMRFWE